MKDIAHHIHQVYMYKPQRDGSVTRHPIGRFMTVGRQLNILEDYHGHLHEALPEGPINMHTLRAMNSLKNSSYLDVVPASKVISGERPELSVGEELKSTRRPSSFDYRRHDQDASDHLEFKEGKAHLNGHQLNEEQSRALMTHVRNGHASIRYKQNKDEAIKKMEGVLQELLKSTREEQEQASSVNEAHGALEQLVKQGLLDPKHLQTLKDHAYKDPMTGNALGNKFAYSDFLNRPRPGVHVMMDGNSFKSINDKFGHSVGDQAIKHFGRALREASDEVGQGKLFRVGGDEFAAHFPTHEHAAQFARSVRNKLESMVPIHGSHKISMAFGFGHTPEHADKALYEAKKQKFHPGTANKAYEAGNEPSMAHSLVPGSEGPIPLDHSQLNIKPPADPVTFKPEPTEQPASVIHTPPASATTPTLHSSK